MEVVSHHRHCQSQIEKRQLGVVFVSLSANKPVRAIAKVLAASTPSLAVVDLYHLFNRNLNDLDL